MLFPISEEEWSQNEEFLVQEGNLRERLVLGSYPELLQMETREEKIIYLNELVSDYLLKDILSLEGIKKSRKILQLLRLVAFQVGSEVSLNELSNSLGIDKNTVQRYMDLLQKVFILFRLGGFSRNLRKEVTKSSKWYFFDNGVRNTLIANFNSLELRNDHGVLWENYMLSERLKFQHYHNWVSNNYFWRTYDQQEIDWVEERGGQLHGYEMKWNPRKTKIPVSWKKTYPKATFEVINRENFRSFICDGKDLI